ncbi:MAG: hypothetical protein ACUVUG_03615 [Candidatus Aminicenantia bacterium]
MRDLVLKAWVKVQTFSLKFLKKRESGQTTIEYILLIIVALILISVIVFFIKGPLQSWWKSAVDAVSSAFNNLKQNIFGS